MNINQAAAAIGCHQSTVSEWISSGRLKAVRKNNREYYIDPADVEAQRVRHAERNAPRQQWVTGTLEDSRRDINPPRPAPPRDRPEPKAWLDTMAKVNAGTEMLAEIDRQRFGGKR
jgi:excisionase family DNA binding protein